MSLLITLKDAQKDAQNKLGQRNSLKHKMAVYVLEKARKIQTETFAKALEEEKLQQYKLGKSGSF